MKILYVASEARPFVKTGGLGDVMGALPKTVASMKNDCRVIIPLYEEIPQEYRQTMRFVGSTYVDLSWRRQYLGVFEYTVDNVVYYFIDNEYYFKRKGLYGHFDDGERFAFFSKAVLEACLVTGFYPDVIHANDWHTALVPVFLDIFYRNVEGLRNTKTVFTIHNIEYQGKYDKYLAGDILGIPENWRSIVECDDDVNYMKAGIERANIVTTVSKTYAEEIKDPYYAYGLAGILNARDYKIRGVVNGIDVDVFNPATDKNLVANYTLKTVAKRAENKKALCELMGFNYSPDRPLMVLISRLTEQKGIDLVATVLDEMLQADIQLVVLGKGDWKYETILKNAEKTYNTKMRAIINFSQELASKLYGAADMFLMPSKSEPCGLSQLIAMRYGAVPIVRETGGLKDTVHAYEAWNGQGNGFTFANYNAGDMCHVICEAIDLYHDNKGAYAMLQQRGMTADFSWTRSAQEYRNIYESICR